MAELTERIREISRSKQNLLSLNETPSYSKHDLPATGDAAGTSAPQGYSWVEIDISQESSADMDEVDDTAPLPTRNTVADRRALTVNGSSNGKLLCHLFRESFF